MFNIKKLFGHKEIHNVKNKYQSELLEWQRKAREQKESSSEKLEMLKSSRMYKIAIATGGKHRGLAKI